MKLRRLALVARTADAEFRYEQRLDNGLQIIRADNSTGKSLAVQGLIYCLGLDHMMGPSSGIPLQHAMTDSIYDETTGLDLPVITSWVEAELEAPTGEMAEIQRYAKSTRYDSGLVQVRLGDEQSDYFVRRPGAAQRAAGFHHFLARFLGWDLPSVLRWDGNEAPLYLECIFPLLVIEQKRGWSGVFAAVPRHLQIRRPGEHAVEFLLDLDAGGITSRLQQVEADLRQLRADWRSYVESTAEAIRGRGVQVRDVPSTATSQIETAEFDLWAATPEGWKPLQEVQESIAEELAELAQEEVARVGDADDARVLEQIEAEQSTFDRLISQGRGLQASLSESRASIDDLQRRVTEIDEDLQKYKDIRTLQRLGSDGASAFQPGECPTCHRPLPDSLLPAEGSLPVLTPDENIVFLEDQRNALRYMLASEARAVETREAELAALRERASDAQHEIRSLRRSLSQPEGSASEADVEKRLRLEHRRERLQEAEQMAVGLETELATMANHMAQLESERQSLRSRRTSEGDRRRLDTFESLIREQLVQYGFRSVDPREIEFSGDDYQPSYEGFDLHFDLSASDLVRLVWAYMVGLLEVSRQFRTNHPGFLLFDEPRQQSAAEVSFQELLRRVSLSAETGQQVVFFTSEPARDVERMLGQVDYNLHEVRGHLLKRQGETDST